MDIVFYLNQKFLFPLQIHVTFDPAGSYAVEGLKPDTLYKFSLAAHSEVGQGVFTQPIEAKTAQSSECPLFIVFITSTNLNLSLWAIQRTSFPLLFQAFVSTINYFTPLSQGIPLFIDKGERYVWCLLVPLS